MKQQTFLSFKKNLKNQRVTLVVVSKKRTLSQIKQLYSWGQKIFGENRVQELCLKQSQLPSDIEWHMIGTLQKNKVKYIAPFISLIHSVDSFRLLEEINKQAEKNNRVIPCLLQVKLSPEKSKHGFEEKELFSHLCKENVSAFASVSIQGVMGMASFSDDEHVIKAECAQLKNIFEKLKKKIFKSSNFTSISMGMSGDYRLAIEEGSTMVRIGSLIFE